MKIVMAQLNPVVGDISGNLARMAETLRRCPKDADLVVFSELYLVGYPPRDLLERPAFIRRSQEALEEVARLSAQYPNRDTRGRTPAHRPGAGQGSGQHRVFVFSGKAPVSSGQVPAAVL
jgi:NAD+ synthase (glutamine-hydrolysing)